jgi:hypothetical protein
MEAVWTWIMAWLNGNVSWAPSPQIVAFIMGVTGLLKLLSKIPFLKIIAGGNGAKALAVLVAFFTALATSLSDGTLQGDEISILIQTLLGALAAAGWYQTTFSADARNKIGK